jgi:hypothetical protein
VVWLFSGACVAWKPNASPVDINPPRRRCP